MGLGAGAPRRTLHTLIRSIVIIFRGVRGKTGCYSNFLFVKFTIGNPFLYLPGTVSIVALRLSAFGFPSFIR
jgi:hypothetical protein